MKNFYVDPITKDITLKNNNLRITENTGEWLSAKIEQVLSVFQGEWFLDYTRGIPYVQEILKKQININDVDSIYKEAIRNITGVSSLTSYSSEYSASTRIYSAQLVVLADDGTVVEVSI